MSTSKTAAVLLIGDELLSGRTRDINLQNIAGFLSPIGLQIREARVVSDDQDQIISALNELRNNHNYVFTTGGIGPTHDDITADAVAAAFDVHIDVREDARLILEERYTHMDMELTEARLKMARIPDAASLIDNPVSGAPGFQIDNVFVLAGVPSIVLGMLQDIGHRLEGGDVVHSVTIRGIGVKEGDIADKLARIAKENVHVSIGSYPFYEGPDRSGVNLVVRGLKLEAIEACAKKISELVIEAGSVPRRVNAVS